MASQMYPRTDDAWDDLSPSEKTWTKWKTTYTQAYNKSLIRKKSTVGTPQFGSAHLSPSGFSSTQHTPHQHYNTTTEYSSTQHAPYHTPHLYPNTHHALTPTFDPAIQRPPPYEHSASIVTPKSTEATEQTVHHLLDYCFTHPKDGITYHSSNMIPCAHSDAGFNNETNGRSRAGAHTFLSDNSLRPPWNGPILSIYLNSFFPLRPKPKSAHYSSPPKK